MTDLGAERSPLEDSNSVTARKRRPLYTVALWAASASQAAGNGGIGRAGKDSNYSLVVRLPE